MCHSMGLEQNYMSTREGRHRGKERKAQGWVPRLSFHFAQRPVEEDTHTHTHTHTHTQGRGSQAPVLGHTNAGVSWAQLE